MGYRIVVAGATGNVGREVLAILAEREFPIAELAAVASSRSQGDEVEIGDTGKTVKCQNIENFDWSGWDMAIFAIGSDATAIHAQGCGRRLRRDRQLVALSHGPRRAADRA